MVVDVQQHFVREASAHVVPVIVDLVARWQAAGGDVVFTRYVNYPGSPFERLMGWSECMASPPDRHRRRTPAVHGKRVRCRQEGLRLFADPAGATLVAE
ncbi:hypothetical protein [Nonomuraea roseoviolacea]|uniref:hypothetical protein n=1 Tax=Nonomuraea roseoviolacea TaxID=103837 RepID=UPI003CD05703